MAEALLSILSTGCQWRALPRGVFAPRSTVQRYFYGWRDTQVWEHLNGRLVEQARVAQGRPPCPSLAVIAAQSVATTESGGARGTDAAKRVKGRKRHIVTDSTGLMLQASVHPADIQDSHGAVPLLRALHGSRPGLRHILAGRSTAAPSFWPRWPIWGPGASTSSSARPG